jgi:predicted transposase YbfD/YdcC
LSRKAPKAKGRELSGIKALLDTLTLKGCIVTIDALGCQTEIAQKILERGGDYLLAAKDNQPHLAEAVGEFFAEGDTQGFGRLPISRHEMVEKGHGRIETRRAAWITDLSQAQLMFPT